MTMTPQTGTTAVDTQPKAGNVKPAALESLLRRLLGKNVTVRKRVPSNVLPKRTVAGIYRDDEGIPVVACMCDIVLAAHAGAALTLFPASVAIDGSREPSLPNPLLENFTEVLNICAQLFNTDPDIHVALREVMTNDKGAKRIEVEFKLGKPLLDLDVEITGYGTGRLILQHIIQPEVTA